MQESNFYSLAGFLHQEDSKKTVHEWHNCNQSLWGWALAISLEKPEFLHFS